jgi:hypothetical protein
MMGQSKREICHGKPLAVAKETPTKAAGFHGTGVPLAMADV